MTQLRMVLVFAPILLAAGTLPPGKPEELGFSSERLKRIHEVVMRRVDAGELTGAVTILARRGRVVHHEAHGVTDLDTKKPMTKDALFHLASSTKPITAAAILILLEEGKLKLTDPVHRFIPEFRELKVAVEGATPVPANRDITIIDLLTHTSGLGSGGASAQELQKILKARTVNETLADVIPRFGTLSLDFQPGTQWRYSGLAGFDTLARIVEIASGLTFEEFLRRRLFEPLGMNNTWFTVPDKESARKVSIYRMVQGKLQKSPVPPALTSAAYTSGAGGLTTTADDYFQFAQMLCNGGILNGKRILSPWTVQLMTSNNAGELFNGQIGRPPKGVGFGLGGEVVVNAIDARLRKPDGSYGWDGAFGTYWWVNRKEQMVAVLFVQTPGRTLHYEFDNAVSQAVVE
jgi:CubicO group peptidase (beta-lactamase class C family)